MRIATALPASEWSWTEKKKAFILDKQGGITRGFTPEEIAGHLPEMLRLQQRGENIYYTPLSENKHHILVDDMSAESLIRLQKDGYRPAVILEAHRETSNVC